MRALTEDHDVEAIGDAIAGESRAELVGSHIAELISALGSFQDQCEWMADERDLPNLAQLLDALREVKDRVKAIEGDIVPVAAELMGQQQVQVGDFKLERFGGKDRKAWQSGSIWSELVRRSRFDRETGAELSDVDARQRLIEMAFACVPFTGSLGWRTRALRSFGIDPDEYCESTPAPFRVEVHHVTDEGSAA
jgi:hypothetical protein